MNIFFSFISEAGHAPREWQVPQADSTEIVTSAPSSVNLVTMPGWVITFFIDLYISILNEHITKLLYDTSIYVYGNTEESL